MDTEFKSFPKIPRLRRGVVVTEKIDGTNAQFTISEDGSKIESIGSRNRFITPEDDNYGFARWVRENEQELLKLGPGTHYGEWMGAGIQRKYGLKEKRFYLFNVGRWTAENPPPSCCRVVPVLFQGSFDDMNIGVIMGRLRMFGSVAIPGFDKPEGIVVYFSVARQLFKVTLDNDDQPKGKASADN